MDKGYSKNKLFEIGKDNYRTLASYCDILMNEGYWERPEAILRHSIYEMMDLYVQAVLVQLAVTCECLNKEERSYITEIPKQNLIGMDIDKDNLEEIISEAQKLIHNPPILLQLCSLRDIEHSSSIAGMFFDTLLNIMLAMAYLNSSNNTKLTGYILGYFHQVSAFLNANSKINYIIDERYVFRKISCEELDICNALLQVSGGDFERYKENLFFIRDRVKLKASNSDSYEIMMDKSQFEKELNKKQGNQDDQVDKEKIQKKDGMKESEELQAGTEELKVETNELQAQNELDSLDTNEKHNNLELLLEELNSLIGLETVKAEMKSLVNLIKVNKLREEYNMPTMDMSYHMVYTGNPGTGKTTVARLVAKIYKELGILTEGNLVETDRSGLVAGYVGQTALKVREVAERAIGGVFFIDEAYALSNNIGNNDFGGEAIDTLVKIMEDHRDNLVVIVAGYKEEMQQFLKANTGLISRFNKFIDFPDYTVEELMLILQSMADKSGFIFEEQALVKFKEMLASKFSEIASKQEEDFKIKFGNARGIRNLFEKIVVNQANRIVTYQKPEKDQLSEIKSEDLSFLL